MQNKEKSEEQACQEKDQPITNAQCAPETQNSADSTHRSKEIAQSENKPKSFIPWSFCFEFLLVIATCTSAGVAFYQWQAMKSQSDIMKGQLDAMAAQTSAAFQQVSTAKSSIRIADEALKDARESGKEQSDRAERLISANLITAQASKESVQNAKQIAKESLDVATEKSRLEQRPWVGLRDFRCDGCTSDADATLTIGNMFGVMENTGKTPAVQMMVSAIWTDRKGSDPIPNYDSIKREMRDPYEVPSWLPSDSAAKIAKTMELTKRFTEPAPTVLPPNAVRALPIIGGAKMGRDRMAFIEDKKIFYVVGKITYFGTERDRQYVTEFCLMNDFGADFRFCPSGNDMH